MLLLLELGVWDGWVWMPECRNLVMEAKRLRGHRQGSVWFPQGWR